MKKDVSLKIKKLNKELDRYGEKKLIKLRQEVNELYFNKHLSKKKIAKKKALSNKFVIRWTHSPEQDFSQDRRGWPKGRRRKWDKMIEKRIKEIHNYLKDDPKEFYAGATAIVQQWIRKYPTETIPPLRTIGRILKELGLSEARKKGRNKGAARYLCYPEYTIYTLLGGRVLEADFIGKKYITGRTQPLNFVGFSFKKEPKLRYYKRIEDQTSDSFISQCKHFFAKFEKPDFIKVDNALTFIGSGSAKRSLSKTIKFLLDNEVIVIFSVPRKPFSQASIEGNNSVFSRMFWNKIKFKNTDEIDEKLQWFNEASQSYTGYEVPRKKEKINKKFTPKLYFIRQVSEDAGQAGRAYIDVLNEKIFLPSSYINYFVLAQWNLDDEELLVHFEKEQESKCIKTLSFEINPRSKFLLK